jgi:hypothetical protein
MRNYLIVLAVLSVASAPAIAQTAPAQVPAQASAQPAKPQMVKKRVCEITDENPYSRLGSRKICRTVEVPAEPSGSQSAQQAPASPDPKGK